MNSIFYILCCIAMGNTAFCYRFHTALGSIVFTNLEMAEDDVHSEHFFGKCAHSYKILLFHHHWTYEELKGKMVLKVFLDLQDEPTCVYIRAKSKYANLIKFHNFKFNFCFCRIVYNYGGNISKYIFYEWYIPVEMIRDVNWDLFFYRG